MVFLSRGVFGQLTSASHYFGPRTGPFGNLILFLRELTVRNFNQTGMTEVFAGDFRMRMLSVITVVKNALADFEATAKSIAIQDIPKDDFEWIVKDGDSDDGTKEALRKLERDSGLVIRSIISKDDGIYDAMNIALDKARGTYVVFLNAGDEFASKHVLRDVSAVIKTGENPTFIFGDVIDFRPDGRELYKRSRKINYIYHSPPTCHQSTFYNRRAIGDTRYDLKYKTAADYHFTAAIFKKNLCRVHYLGFAVAKFQIGGFSTLNKKQYIYEAGLVQKELLGVPLCFRLLNQGFGYCAWYGFKYCPWLYSKIRKIADTFCCIR